MIFSLITGWDFVLYNPKCSINKIKKTVMKSSKFLYLMIFFINSLRAHPFIYMNNISKLEPIFFESFFLLFHKMYKSFLRISFEEINTSFSHFILLSTIFPFPDIWSIKDRSSSLVWYFTSYITAIFNSLSIHFKNICHP